VEHWLAYVDERVECRTLDFFNALFIDREVNNWENDGDDISGIFETECKVEWLCEGGEVGYEVDGGLRS
jgi:hypothetical protein